MFVNPISSSFCTVREFVGSSTSLEEARKKNIQIFQGFRRESGYMLRLFYDYTTTLIACIVKVCHQDAYLVVIVMITYLILSIIGWCSMWSRRKRISIGK